MSPASDGTPLPGTLAGDNAERLIRIDIQLLYLVTGALRNLVDFEPLEQTGALTVEEARAALNDMLNCYLFDCTVTPPNGVNVEIGSMVMWPNATPPDGWLICNGAAISRSLYADLFAVLGVIWGAGDGSTTFNLPQFVDRSPIGAGGSIALGNPGGAMSRTLTTNELPAHTHGTPSPFITYIGNRQTGGVYGFNNGTAFSVFAQNASVGNGAAFSILHPVAAVHMIIYSGVVTGG
jgi:microcystin-dependent protein